MTRHASDAGQPSENLDPTTGKPLPAGVWYRGPRQYAARRQVDGKRVRRTFDTAVLAQRWLRQTSARAELGQFVDTRPLDRLTLGALVERYRDECMADRAADRLGHVPALLRDETLCAVKLSRFCTADVRRWRDRMVGSEYAPGTVVKRLNLLAAVIQHAISEWDIGIVNHASGRVVKRPEGADRKRNRRLNGDVGEDGAPELDRLIEAMAGSSCPDDVWLVRWSIEQGTRRGEAVGMTWGAVDLNRRTLSLPRTKTDRHRDEQGPEVRPLTPGAIRLLRERLASLPEPPRLGEPVFRVGTESAFSVRYGRLVKRAGLNGLTFHDLRHEATSRLARMLPNPLDLKRVTGHRDLKSLDRYYQPVPESISRQIEEAERLAGVIAAEDADDGE